MKMDWSCGFGCFEGGLGLDAGDESLAVPSMRGRSFFWRRRRRKLGLQDMIARCFR